MNEKKEREYNTIRKENTKEILMSVSKCGSMGSESAIGLMKSIKSDDQKSEMTAVLDGYQRLSKRSAELLGEIGEKPEDAGTLAKLGAKLGMTFNTMMDSSPSHIAEMVIEGANMGITDMQAAINHYGNDSVDKRALELAKDAMSYNEKVINEMKKYL